MFRDLVAQGFGAALGLSAISAEQGEASYPIAGLVIAALFMVVSSVAAYATGGYIAGRMRRPAEIRDIEETKIRDGMNGLIVWAVGTVVALARLPGCRSHERV